MKRLFLDAAERRWPVKLSRGLMLNPERIESLRPELARILRDRTLREELYRYVGGILNQLDCQSIIVGGVEDHVHLLSALARTRQLFRSDSLAVIQLLLQLPVRSRNAPASCYR